MSAWTLDDLAGLARPAILEELSIDAIFASRQAELVERLQAAGIDYSVEDLQTDPAMILLQEAAFEETILRARANDVARARYLYYARLTEVDHLGAFYDVVRLPGELDARFKLRIRLAIQGRSTGGTEPGYRGAALGASLRVADARVYRDGRAPIIHVAVFAADNNGVADATLLGLVRTALEQADRQVINDTIDVRSAVVDVVPVAADVWLLPDADVSLIDTLRDGLQAAWAEASGLGRDLTRAWLASRLMADGVANVVVTAPAADLVVPFDRAVRLALPVLTYRGRSY